MLVTVGVTEAERERRGIDTQRGLEPLGTFGQLEQRSERPRVIRRRGRRNSRQCRDPSQRRRREEPREDVLGEETRRDRRLPRVRRRLAARTPDRRRDVGPHVQVEALGRSVFGRCAASQHLVCALRREARRDRERPRRSFRHETRQDRHDPFGGDERRDRMLREELSPDRLAERGRRRLEEEAPLLRDVFVANVDRARGALLGRNDRTGREHRSLL